MQSSADTKSTATNEKRVWKTTPQSSNKKPSFSFTMSYLRKLTLEVEASKPAFGFGVGQSGFKLTEIFSLTDVCPIRSLLFLSFWVGFLFLSLALKLFQGQQLHAWDVGFPLFGERLHPISDKYWHLHRHHRRNLNNSWLYDFVPGQEF